MTGASISDKYKYFEMWAGFKPEETKFINY